MIPWSLHRDLSHTVQYAAISRKALIIFSPTASTCYLHVGYIYSCVPLCHWVFLQFSQNTDKPTTGCLDLHVEYGEWTGTVCLRGPAGVCTHQPHSLNTGQCSAAHNVSVIVCPWHGLAIDSEVCQ